MQPDLPAKEKLVEGSWIRWEMEWKSERVDAVGMALSGLDQDSFQKYIVGVFRSALDFRDCTRADDPKDRYYAPLLDWWNVLTEGMQRARLEIVKSVQKIEDVKRGGKHLALLASGQDAQRLRKKMREWDPRNGFSAGSVEPTL